MSFLSTATGVGIVDARIRRGTITLPLTSQIPNRYLQFKDLYGAFNRSSLTLSTQAGESFDDGTTSKVFSEQFTFLTLYAASTTKWAQLGGTQTIQQTISSLTVSSITIGSGYGWLQMPPIQTVAFSTNTINADTIITNSTTSLYISAQVLYVSSIIGVTIGGGTGNVTTANLTSTVVGLGTVGYLSTGGGGGGVTTANLTSTVVGLGTAGYLSTGGGGGVTTANLTSTVVGLGTAGYLSTGGGVGVTTANLVSTTQALQSAPTQFVSSLTVNAMTVGTGAGWLQLPPIQTIYASTTYVQGQALYTLSSYFGTGSTITALQFYGLFSNYNNTVIAEVSTGVGTQELLFFKGSSTSDRVRVQTTGNFVVETGISARMWDSSALTIQSNVTPAMIINSSSNVGIQTATPGATLDVAGTGRFITASSISMYTGALYTGVYFI